jgi:UDP-N-acetylmuramoylalanine--D-glutamate ligase
MTDFKKDFYYKGSLVQHVWVLGYGVTGKSVYNFLLNFNVQVYVYDEKLDLPSDISYLNIKKHDQAVELIITSPGIDLSKDIFSDINKLPIPIVSDIEIFLEYNNKPIIAITGTNGKTTVVTLINDILNKYGYISQKVGNIGLPALSMLDCDTSLDYYVMELSSFQLEYIYTLNAEIGCILNITTDHLDRHKRYECYYDIKCRILEQSKNNIINTNIKYNPKDKKNRNVFFINGGEGYRLSTCHKYLKFGDKIIAHSEDFLVNEKHNLENYLFVLAITDLLNIPSDKVLELLKLFKGLNHRCEYLGSYNKIKYYNDSKGTNVDATLAALESLGEKKNIILLLGGVSKDGDFKKLIPFILKYVKSILIFGKDRWIIEDHLRHSTYIKLYNSLSETLSDLSNLVVPGDLVLLSPGCASYDEFINYEDRGDFFKSKVINGETLT